MGNNATSTMAQIEKMTDMAGKYLTFQLSTEEYGIEILKVREIIGLMPITIVPRTPKYIRGVINLRGKIIPVIDLRVKFGMVPAKDTELTCIIVVDSHKNHELIQMGILVDTVSEVLDINEKEIEPPPSFGATVDSGFILGMAKVKQDVKILLNIEDVLNKDELQTIGDMNSAKTVAKGENQDSDSASSDKTQKPPEKEATAAA